MDVIADRYELGRTLGAGGMARVVEAHDRVLDRKVAIKLLRDDISMDPSIRERFLREARTAAKFNHPNAVAVYDTGQDGRQPWIVMELIEGEDLAQRLGRDGALPEGEAVEIADAVLAALAAAHRDGMVHRDVKPGNIMLLHDGRVKLADFGIAKSVQEATAGLTSTGQVIGTAKYLSPEQVEGQPATPASDVYATGIVLYEMLTGEPPFTGDSAIAIALAHTRDTVPDLRRAAPRVTPGVAAVVDRALAKDPARRFADAGEMRRALAGEHVAAAAAGAAASTAVLDPASQRTQVLDRDERAAPARSWWPLLLLGIIALIAAVALLRNLDGATPADTTQPPPAEETEAPAEEETPPPAEEDTEPEDPEPTQPPLPRDIPSLITLLLTNPDEYGPAQENLRKGLEEVVTREDEQERASKAAELQDKAVEWVQKGELEPVIGEVAVTLLDPLTQVSEPEPDEDDEGNPGQGNAKGKDKKDD